MEILYTKTGRALCQTQIELADYVINPYKGCLTGCMYCYARSNSQIVKIAKQWGEYVYIKDNFLDLLKQDIASAGKINRVLIGSTTEPFQAMDTQHCIMDSILQVLKANAVPCVILTKSKRAGEFAALLAYSNRNRVYITYNSEIVRQLFEKKSCLQVERLAAAENLLKAGIDTILYISPVIPYLTEVAELLSNIKGKAATVYFESYNPKLGNWEELKSRLIEYGINKEVIINIEQIYQSEVSYNDYWQQFVESIRYLNRDYGFKMEFFIYPYDSYYRPGA